MLRRYLSGLFVARLLGSLLGLVSILQLLNLLDRAGAIIERGGLAGIGRYTALRLPSLVAEMIPLAVLIGAVLTFLRLSGSLEMVAMRASGLSLLQVLRALAPVCLLVSATQFALRTEVAPRTERALAEWWFRTAPSSEGNVAPTPGGDPAPARLWLRSRGDLAAVDRVSSDGTRLEGITVVQRSAGSLVARLDARSAQYQDGRWTLHDVRIARPGENAAETRPALDWPHGPAPANMVELARPVEAMTLGRLIDTLRGDWVGARGPAFYRTQLQGVLAATLDPVLMVLLAAPVLLAPPRSGGGGLPAAASLALGLGYLVLAGLLGALGNAGTLPPAAAGWASAALFAAIGCARVLQADDG